MRFAGKLPDSSLLGAVLIVGIGLLLSGFTVGRPLGRLSYDLPFAFRTRIAAPELVLVYLDEESARQLGAPLDRPWPRSLEVTLLERLIADGARLVYYDIFFETPGDDPAVDDAFAAAMRRHGNVVLGAIFDETEQHGVGYDIRQQHARAPLELFQDAARAWGLAAFHPYDPDFGVRQIAQGTEHYPTLSWVAAEALKAPVTRDPANRLRPRWLNYYGPPGTIPTVSFSQVVSQGVEPGFFRGKIVCIGGKPAAGGLNLGRDEFANPYSRFGDLFSPGLEIHATELLNLLRGDWLNRMPPWIEMAVVIIVGLGAVMIAFAMTPGRATIALLGFFGLICIAALLLQWHGRLWFNWLVPAAVQIPVALFWGAGARYLGESRKRAQLRDAFSFYLSPQMADRITNMEFDLKPGGKLVEATVLFSDCKGFTAMSEELHDPQKISDTLIAYFTEASRHVLENDGTIIKYIGDAVFACWNAPITEADHAGKAARAAWAMHEASKQTVMGRNLITRVGVCTGDVLAGNLGSPYRFDYTCIGETVNFASRLEGLNKFLGTGVLISDTTRSRLGDRFVLRALGTFTVVGQTQPAAIHELIAPVKHPPESIDWLGAWQAAMQALREGDFAAMQKALRAVVWQRGGHDGPAEFYLKYLAKLEKEDALREWPGVVKITEK